MQKKGKETDEKNDGENCNKMALCRNQNKIALNQFAKFVWIPQKKYFKNPSLPFSKPITITGDSAKIWILK